MWSCNASNPEVSSKSSENCRDGITDLGKNCSSIDGPVAILWDIENCCVPSNVNPESVASNIRMALQTHLIKGSVVMFSAYGDFSAIPRKVREGCQRTGVKLVDVPNGRKDAADKAILVDMFLFALDNRPPSSIMLISGDVDFAPALHILGQRGYTVILVKPSGSTVSPALSAAGKFVWDWPIVARGEGLVPVGKAFALPYQAQQVHTVWESGPACDYDLNPDTDYAEKLHTFRGLNTPTFDGTANSIQAEEWLDLVEKNFDAIWCPAEYRVRMITCLLLGEAEQWWRSVQSDRLTDVVITWEDFVTAFIEKHYPASVRMERMLELMKLEQGSMTVTAYEQRFSKLFRFGTNMIPTEKLKALKFRQGLRPSIRTKVDTFCLSSYSELVSHALRAERNEQTEGSVCGSPSYHQNMHVPHDCRSMEERTPRPPKKATVAKPKRRSCDGCGKFHRPGPCRKLNGTCYRCGQAGHGVRDCPHALPRKPAAPSFAEPTVQSVTGLQIGPVVHHYVSTDESELYRRAKRGRK